MKSLLPILAILLGIIVSQVYVYAFLIKYLLMVMLLFPFLKISIKTFYPHALWIVIANIVIPIGVYLIILPFNSELAFLCFVTAITPTATAAPAVMDFFKRKCWIRCFICAAYQQFCRFNYPFFDFLVNNSRYFNLNFRSLSVYLVYLWYSLADGSTGQRI